MFPSHRRKRRWVGLPLFVSWPDEPPWESWRLPFFDFGPLRSPLVGNGIRELTAPGKDSHLEGIEGEVGAETCRHSPVDDPTGKGIHDERGVAEAGDRPTLAKTATSAPAAGSSHGLSGHLPGNSRGRGGVAAGRRPYASGPPPAARPRRPGAAPLAVPLAVPRRAPGGGRGSSNVRAGPDSTWRKPIARASSRRSTNSVG